jgi:hypothetical protein
MMFEMSGWFIIPAMPTISLVLAWMSNIPNKPIRQLIAFTWMLISLSIPLHVSTGSVGSDYALAIVILCYSLKIIELFFCEPFATDIYSMPIFPFMVLLMTYQDPPQFQEWFDAASYPPNSSSSDKGSRSRVNSSSQQDKKEKEKEKKKIDAKFVIQKGRAHGLRLWMRAVGYWLGLNVVMAILPPNPSHAFQTWPRTSWQFWAFTFATACGAYLVMALAYSALMGFYAFLWGIYVKEIFNYPFFAYSLREWWSKRWNLCYKDQYFRIVFMALYGNEDKNININQHQHPQKLTASSSNKKSKIKATVAALATFLFSGIIQYLILFMI